jgi:hypothetical protein
MAEKEEVRVGNYALTKTIFCLEPRPTTYLFGIKILYYPVVRFFVAQEAFFDAN